jgi:hypothetical protein
MRPRTGLATITLLVLLTGTMTAQWVNYPTPDIPRLPDGKPNLKAPPPRTADGHVDLSGIWDAGNMIYFHNLAQGLKPGDVVTTPWATAIRKARMDRNHVDDPYGYCLPLGVPRVYTRSPFKIVYTPKMMIFLHESIVGNTFRQVFTDGRPLPKLSDVEPAWLGYSVGRWEGDTFVVESTGYEDRTWVDYFGYPHSDAMHLEERYRRTAYDTLELNMTLTDSKFYAKPWKSQTKRFKLLPKDFIKTPDGWAGLLEDICAPVDELEFNRVIRDPAGTGKPPVPPPARR